MTVFVPSLPNDIINMIMEINTNKIKQEKKKHKENIINNLNDHFTLQPIQNSRLMDMECPIVKYMGTEYYHCQESDDDYESLLIDDDFNIIYEIKNGYPQLTDTGIERREEEAEYEKNDYDDIYDTVYSSSYVEEEDEYEFTMAGGGSHWWNYIITRDTIYTEDTNGRQEIDGILVMNEDGDVRIIDEPEDMNDDFCEGEVNYESCELWIEK